MKLLTILFLSLQYVFSFRIVSKNYVVFIDGESNEGKIVYLLTHCEHTSGLEEAYGFHAWPCGWWQSHQRSAARFARPTSGELSRSAGCVMVICFSMCPLTVLRFCIETWSPITTHLNVLARFIYVAASGIPGRGGIARCWGHSEVVDARVLAGGAPLCAASGDRYPGAVRRGLEGAVGEKEAGRAPD